MTKDKDESPTIENLMKEEETTTPIPGTTPGKSNWERILTATSPDKKIELYSDHVLNYDGKDSTGRIIRGSEGIAGSLDKAIIDIVVGVIQKGREFWDEIQAGKDP